MKKGGLLLAMLLLLIPFCLGTTIHGKVFDYNFAVAKNSVVSISTVPEQQIVAVDGTYSFSVPKGDFVISAMLKDISGSIVYFVNDTVSIANDGDYVRDLIMFPSNDLDELDLENDFSELSVEANPAVQRIVLIVVALALIFIFIWLYCGAFRKNCKIFHKLIPRIEEAKPEKKKEAVEADDIYGLADFIKKNKRVTQKEIRKAFPLSEAKISLMISDLESQGKIRKIKKGRGNIIVWDEK
ncbi:hypothetical protein JW756_03545 [Candidatus Woesearchaeota archaeon]|nr:hypothetical protein [Candidatus Woesearchaeota archaeon]